MRLKRKSSLLVACCMAFSMLAQGAIPANAETPAAVEYTRSAEALDLDELPGVYATKANPGDGMETEATMGIPTVAKQTLAEAPTTETPAIIMGAAVNYEKKTGPVDYEPLVPGTETLAEDEPVRIYLKNSFWGIVARRGKELVWKAQIAPEDGPEEMK